MLKNNFKPNNKPVFLLTVKFSNYVTKKSLGFIKTKIKFIFILY